MINHQKVYIPHIFYDNSPRTNSFVRIQFSTNNFVRTETCVRFIVLIHVLIDACRQRYFALKIRTISCHPFVTF